MATMGNENWKENSKVNSKVLSDGLNNLVYNNPGCGEHSGKDFAPNPTDARIKLNIDVSEFPISASRRSSLKDKAAYFNLTSDNLSNLSGEELIYKSTCLKKGYCWDNTAGGPRSLYNKCYSNPNKSTIMITPPNPRDRDLNELYCEAPYSEKEVTKTIISSYKSIVRNARDTVNALLTLLKSGRSDWKERIREQAKPNFVIKIQWDDLSKSEFLDYDNESQVGLLSALPNLTEESLSVLSSKVFIHEVEEEWNESKGDFDRKLKKTTMEMSQAEQIIINTIAYLIAGNLPAAEAALSGIYKAFNIINKIDLKLFKKFLEPLNLHENILNGTKDIDGFLPKLKSVFLYNESVGDPHTNLTKKNIDDNIYNYLLSCLVPHKDNINALSKGELVSGKNTWYDWAEIWTGKISDCACLTSATAPLAVFLQFLVHERILVKLTKIQRINSYCFMFLYSFGHEAGHEPLRLISKLNFIDKLEENFTKGLITLADISESRAEVAEIRANYGNLLDIITLEGVPNPLFNKNAIRQEGLADVLSYSLLEYILKTELSDADGLIGFTHNLKTICGWSADGTHPVGSLRINLVKTNKYIFNLLLKRTANSVGGGKRQNGKNKTKKLQYAGRRFTKKRNTLQNKTKKNRR